MLLQIIGTNDTGRYRPRILRRNRLWIQRELLEVITELRNQFIASANDI